LAHDRTAPVTANVSRLAEALPDYAVETAYKSFKRESIDRILDLAVKATDDGFPPLKTLDRIATDAVRVTKGERKRDPHAIRRRIDKLFTIGRQLAKIVGGGHQTCQHVFRAARELQSL
jgi:hypothetical protein